MVLSSPMRGCGLCKAGKALVDFSGIDLCINQV